MALTLDENCGNQLQSAYLEYKNKNYIETQNICKTILTYYPNDINVLILLSSSYFHCKQFDEAMSYIKKALLLNPSSPDLLRNRGSILWEQSLRIEAIDTFYNAVKDSKDYDDCWELYAKATVTYSPETTDKCYQLILMYKPNLYNVRCDYGNFLLSINKVEEAEEQYLKAIESAPNCAKPVDSLGCLYFHRNNIEDALEQFSKAIALDPTFADSLIHLGMCSLKNLNYDPAIEKFKEALALEPTNFNAAKYLALAYVDQNLIDSAIDVHKQFLEIQPNSVEINYNLAKIYYHYKRNYEEAAKHFNKCMEQDRNNEELHDYLIELNVMFKKHKCASKVLISKGDLVTDKNDKILAYSAALFLDPYNADGYWKLGLAYYEINDLDMALKRVHSSITLRPIFPDAYCDCALIYEKQNNYEAALKYYNLALQLKPDHATSMENLTIMYKKIGNIDESIKIKKRLLELQNTDHFEIHMELGNMYTKIKGDVEQGISHYAQALSIDNTCIESYLNLGNAFLEVGRSEGALASFNAALNIDARCVKAHLCIGSIHKDDKHFDEAIKSYSTVLKLNPDFPDAYCNLVLCLRYSCNWISYDSYIKKLNVIVSDQLNFHEVPSISPKHSLLYPFHPETVKKIASKYADECIKKCIENKLIQNFNHPTSLSNDRIHVGYVSSSFVGDHPISDLMESILDLHDKNKFEVFCYSLTSDGSSSVGLSGIATESCYFRDISKLNVIDAAKKINDDGIHILIDMNGYSKDARNEIFALRPAPIQVLWLGYPGTVGAPFIDYLITDEVCCPSEFKEYYTEKFAYMKRSVFIGNYKQNVGDSSLCTSQKLVKNENNPIKTTVSIKNGNFSIKSNSVNDTVSNVTSSMNVVKLSPEDSHNSCTRQMYNLPEGVIVYCNFNKLYKIDSYTFRRWLDILQLVPNSVLWLLRTSNECVNNIIAFCQETSVTYSRIIFADFEPKDKYMRRLQLADIVLDTFSYNNHKITLDALWVGLPVVTYPGQTFSSRVAASQLATFGCAPLIAVSEEEYVSRAIDLGLNKANLAELKSIMHDMKKVTKLFDCELYTDGLENIYQDIWNNFVTEKQE